MFKKIFGSKKLKLSFVIPCYCSEKNIETVVLQIMDVMKQLPSYTYEFILVNDCSPDNTIYKLKKLCKTYDNITAVNLVKNQGQPSALLCGFSFATGDFIVCGDDDGQTAFEYIPQMLNALIENDFDIVCARYKTRDNRSILRNFGTKINEKMMEIIFEKGKEISLSAFFIAKNYLIKEIIKYKGPYPYLAGLILRTTRNIGNLDVPQKKRISGSSGYNLIKLVRLWLDGFTSFSVKPLRIAALFGFILSIAGFIWGIILIGIKFLNKSSTLPGWTSIMSVIIFVGGVIMLLLGIMGEYIGRIYICINQAPQYTIKEVIHK